MRNKVLATMLALVIIIVTSMPVFATPNEEKLIDSRQKYAEIENKIVQIETQIYDLNTQIEPLQLAVDKNRKEIEKINNVVENTKKDIEQCREEINDLDLVLGQRVKAMYSTGDLEFNYIKFVLEAESTSELFSRVEAVSEIVTKDKTSIEKIASKKKELDLKIVSLQDKKNEINNLNKEVKDTINDLDKKKREEETLVDKTKEEKSKFDSEYLSQLEREAVKTQFDVIDNINSLSSEIEGAINQLISIKNNQIKSPIIIKEIEDKIEKAKVIVSEKKISEAMELETSGVASKVKSRVAAPAAGKAQAVLNEAYEQLGKPYVWGATGLDTFDCSGFTQYVYKQATGIDISRTTYTQINVGQPVSEEQLEPGDLVFPHTGHVGIYVGNGQMIHAPHTGDVVKVGPVFAFYAARRIL